VFEGNLWPIHYILSLQPWIHQERNSKFFQIMAVPQRISITLTRKKYEDVLVNKDTGSLHLRSPIQEKFLTSTW